MYPPFLQILSFITEENLNSLTWENLFHRPRGDVSRYDPVRRSVMKNWQISIKFSAGKTFKKFCRKIQLEIFIIIKRIIKSVSRYKKCDKHRIQYVIHFRNGDFRLYEITTDKHDSFKLKEFTSILKHPN